LLPMFTYVFSAAGQRRVSGVPTLTVSAVPARHDLHRLWLAEDDRLAPAP
jgi:hypothetical protein